MQKERKLWTPKRDASTGFHALARKPSYDTSTFLLTLFANEEEGSQGRQLGGALGSRIALPRSLTTRTGAYGTVLELRRNLGWSYKRIARHVGLPRSTVHSWIREKHSPYGSCSIPDLEPSALLSYFAGAFLGDGGLIRSAQYHYELRFRVKDREFAECYSDCLSAVLGKSKRPRQDENGFFVVRVWSRLLFEFLSSWNSIRETAERYPREFVGGFADAEGSPVVSVGRSRQVLGVYVVIVNTNRKLLNLVRTLMRNNFAIRSNVFLERKHHRMWSKLPCYHLTIGRREDQRRFADTIGFRIKRKQEKLWVALSLLDAYGPSDALREWHKLYEKRGRTWVRAN